MEIKAALLADAARVESGKLYVHGGGWDTMVVGTTPAVHASLSVVVVLDMGWNEAFRPMQVGVDLYDEDNVLVVAGQRGLLQLGHPPNSAPGMNFSVPWQSTFNGLRFEKEGIYSFRVMVDQTELASVRCRVTRLQIPMLPGMGVGPEAPAEGPLPPE